MIENSDQQKPDVAIDLREMGRRYGLETEDIIRDGRVIMQDYIWTKNALQRAAKECYSRAKDSVIAEIIGYAPNWVHTTIACAIHPTVCLFRIGPNGVYELTATPFPISAAVPTCGMHFDVDEDGENVFVKAVNAFPYAAEAHGFDLNKFDDIIMPPIPAGKNVFLSGETVIPVSVSMALTYAEISRSIHMRFHAENEYHCCLTRSSRFTLGDTVPVK